MSTVALRLLSLFINT